MGSVDPVLDKLLKIERVGGFCFQGVPLFFLMWKASFHDFSFFLFFFSHFGGMFSGCLDLFTS